MKNLFLVATLMLPATPAKVVKVEKAEPDTDRLSQLIRQDLDVIETASVKSVTCSEHACRIAFVVKDDDGTNFQMAIFRFLQANPEFGSGFKLEDAKDDPKLAYFIIFKEKTLD